MPLYWNLDYWGNQQNRFLANQDLILSADSVLINQQKLWLVKYSGHGDSFHAFHEKSIQTTRVNYDGFPYVFSNDC